MFAQQLGLIKEPKERLQLFPTFLRGFVRTSGLHHRHHFSGLRVFLLLHMLLMLQPIVPADARQIKNEKGLRMGDGSRIWSQSGPTWRLQKSSLPDCAQQDNLVE